MASRARRDEGRRDEDRPDRVLHRHRLPAPRVPRDLPGAARQAAHRRAGDALGEGPRGARGGVRRAGPRASSPRSSRRPSPPPRSARCTARRCSTARTVAVKIQYPGIAEALESDLRNAGMLVRLAQALAPGLDAKAVASELRERVLEELDYEYEAQNQRTFARAYRRAPVHLRARSDSPALAPPGAGHRATSRGAASSEVKELTQDERDTSARSSSASASARSTTCSTSTPTPIPATTC